MSLGRLVKYFSFTVSEACRFFQRLLWNPYEVFAFFSESVFLDECNYFGLRITVKSRVVVIQF